MLVPLSWLKQYTDVNMTPVEYSNGITDSGSHVDSVRTLGKETSKILLGKVLEVKPHPNADRLNIIKVDVGPEGEKTIVTGAKNVVAGKMVPVALDGAFLADGTKITNTDFRGIESEGMLCSLQELGVEENVIPKAFVDGIYLTDEGAPGDTFASVIGSEEAIIEIEVTPNRPDCLSMIGMARETAATFQTELRIPEGREKNPQGDVSEYLRGITIESEDCFRYMGRVIRDVNIVASPQWMQNALMQAGVRPINNIVDITNFVMLEMGVPLHAFDVDTLDGQQIIIRKAREGETITLLNGNKKAVKADDLVICDANRPVALAGVMGGLETEISENTKNILIECAVFDRESVRLTAKRHNMRSEASSRYEKGLTPIGLEKVMDRVCQLAEEIGVGTVVGGVIDEKNFTEEKVVVKASVERINYRLGTSISPQEMKNLLERLFFTVELHGDEMTIYVPHYRTDIQMQDDISEEVARLYGYHNIIPQPIEGSITEGGKTPMRSFEDEARQILYALGFSETLTYSFMGDSSYDLLAIEDDDPLRDGVKLLNPLGDEYSIMRTTLLPNLFITLRNNYNHGQERLLVYELGNTFHKNKPLPEERRVLAMGMYGESIDFYTLKSAIQALFKALHLPELKFAPVKNKAYLHEGRAAEFSIDGQIVGVMGELSFAAVERLDIDKRVYVAEIDFESLLVYQGDEKKFKPIHRFPAIKRDLALVVDRSVLAQDVLDALKTVESPLIQKIELFDVYEGQQVETGKKSLAFEITYQDPAQTLKDEDATSLHTALQEAAERLVGATLRA